MDRSLKAVLMEFQGKIDTESKRNIQ